MQKYFINHINQIMTYLTAYYQGQLGTACNKPELKAKDLKNYPEFLYKYRSCEKKYNFESLEEDYIWADYPALFDDPIDAKINLDFDQEWKNLRELTGEYHYESIRRKLSAPGERKRTLFR